MDGRHAFLFDTVPAIVASVPMAHPSSLAHIIWNGLAVIGLLTVFINLIFVIIILISSQNSREDHDAPKPHS
jgi:uncharacterized membrane protein YhdT